MSTSLSQCRRGSRSRGLLCWALLAVSLGAQAELTLAEAERLALAADPAVVGAYARANALQDQAVADGQLPVGALRVACSQFLDCLQRQVVVTVARQADLSLEPGIRQALRDAGDALLDVRAPRRHLDHLVLNAARSAARPRRNKAIRWLRPAAWVATVGVCLAIVVEISLLDDEGTAEMDSLTPAAAPPAAESPLTAPAW